MLFGNTRKSLKDQDRAVIKGDNPWVAVLMSLITGVQEGERAEVPVLTTGCLDDAVAAVSHLCASVSPSSSWRLGFSPALQKLRAVLAPCCKF